MVGHDIGHAAVAKTLLARRIMHLLQRLGGGGIQSVATTRKTAYVSSWALVGEEIAKHIPNLTTRQEHIAGLQKAFTQLKDTGLHSKIAEKTVEGLISNQLPQLQHHLLEDINFKEAGDIRRSMVGEERATFVSAATREAGAWITASPYHTGCQMSNINFSTALKLRLHLPIVPEGQRCAHCKKQVPSDGYHTFHCSNPPLVAARTVRHTAVKDAIFNITQNLRNVNLRVRAEQSMQYSGFARQADGKFEDHRMDIAVLDEAEGPDATYVIDVMVTTIQEDSITPYTAAKEGEDKKIAHYTKHYIIPSAHRFLVPWVVEVPGAWGPKGRAFALWLSKQVQSRGGGMTSQAFYRLLVERVAVALQSSVANSVRTMARGCEPAAS
jgi:hypothetical protein